MAVDIGSSASPRGYQAHGQALVPGLQPGFWAAVKHLLVPPPLPPVVIIDDDDEDALDLPDSLDSVEYNSNDAVNPPIIIW
ncbi:hypothetical protein P154DRAFT_517209 [Amniculicola lignicola CBS 123094]|uniref:Uncharacterized protein n=1 Tax=Amniculicola lignicola CBS 123094 TaxID=1392246 RepID=A0A6A5X3Q3_9PLEO|nr:hypothetical protein P154DRAFT_517209 [Amniculicola lignicola CBS 123094]